MQVYLTNTDLFKFLIEMDSIKQKENPKVFISEKGNYIPGKKKQFGNVWGLKLGNLKSLRTAKFKTYWSSWITENMVTTLKLITYHLSRPNMLDARKNLKNSFRDLKNIDRTWFLKKTVTSPCETYLVRTRYLLDSLSSFG